MKIERNQKKEMGMRKHGILSMLIFCVGSSLLSVKGNGYLPLSYGAKVAVGIIFLGLLWIPLVRLFNYIKSKC